MSAGLEAWAEETSAAIMSDAGMDPANPAFRTDKGPPAVGEKSSADPAAAQSADGSAAASALFEREVAEMRAACKGGVATKRRRDDLALELKCSMFEAVQAELMRNAMNAALKGGVAANEEHLALPAGSRGAGWYQTTPAQQAALAALPPMQRQSDAVVPRLTQAQTWELSPNAFQHKYVALNKPVIFTDKAVLPSTRNLWLSDTLENVRGDLTFKVSENPYPETFGSRPSTMELADFAEQVLRQDQDFSVRGDGPNGALSECSGSRCVYHPADGAAADGTGAAAAAKAAAEQRRYTPTLADPSTSPLHVPGIDLDRRYIFQPLPESMIGDLGDPKAPTMPMFEAKKGFFDDSQVVVAGTAKTHGELFIGPALSGSQPHAHTAAWNHLVFGRKRWYLWPKLCYSLGYADGHGMSVWEWALTRLPKLQGTVCAPFEFEQIPGEVVFVPYGWHHAVLNLEPSIGLSKQLGNPSDLQEAFDAYAPSDA